MMKYFFWGFNLPGNSLNFGPKILYYWDVEAVPPEKILKIESPNLSVI